MSEDPILVSHHLCPYVQRAAIALAEKGVAYERHMIDLGNKPAWFEAVSPLGKVPLLRVGDTVIFESAVILEYLEETAPHPLHPSDPLARARHRSWIAFASSLLNDIAGFYNAAGRDAADAKAAHIAAKFRHLEDELGAGPWFAGGCFSLVDAAFGPVFRYFDVFDRLGDWPFMPASGPLRDWRQALHERPSVRHAVAADYPERLRDFLALRGGYLAQVAASRNKPAIRPVSAA